MTTLQLLAKQDKKQFNILRRAMQKDVRQRPSILTEVNNSDVEYDGPRPDRTWVSRDFLVSLYDDPTCLRMTVCRTQVDNSGNWVDGITWDELESIKEIIGYGDMWGLEVYPPSDSIVNVANMRHIFLFPNKPEFAWGRSALAD